MTPETQATHSLESLRAAYAERACAPLIAHLRALRDVHLTAYCRDLKLGLANNLGKEYRAESTVEAGGGKVFCDVYGCSALTVYPLDSDDTRERLANRGTMRCTVNDQTDAPALAAALAAEELRLRGLVATARAALAAAEHAADATRAALLASIPTAPAEGNSP